MIIKTMRKGDAMIQKERPSGNYTPISNEVFRDVRLTLTDRGLLATLMSLPEEWDFSVTGMARILPDGKDRIQRSMRHLEELGYITTIQERGNKGDYRKNVMIINSAPKPLAGNPSTGNPLTDKPSAENHAQYKNYYKKPNNTKEKDKKNTFFNFKQREYPEEFYDYLEKELINRQLGNKGPP